MLPRIESIIQGNCLCVLATMSEKSPLCSLMFYHASKDCLEIYLATKKSSSKYRNITGNQNISLLIDTRQAVTCDSSYEAKALTIQGKIGIVTDIQKEISIRLGFSEKNPGMYDFFHHPETAMLCVSVRSILLLDGPDKSHHENFEDE